MLLASFIPAFAATTWPAGTNTPNQTFYGNNNFLGQLRQNGVDVLTNVPNPLNLTTMNIGTLNVTNPPVLNGINITNIPYTNLMAPDIIVWSGPTNSLTLGYPWSKTTYVMASDISVTNFLGITNGYPCEASFVLTNSSATSCAVRFPATAIGYGTLITNETAYVLAGKKAIVAVMSGQATNWAIVQQSQ